MDSISRDPAGEDTSTLIADMTKKAIDLRTQMASFDSATQTKLAGRHELADIAGMSDLIGRPDLKDILSEDSCIWPRQEIFTEKVAVYNAVIIDGTATPRPEWSAKSITFSYRRAGMPMPRHSPAMTRR